MAVMTATELAELRRMVATRTTVDFDKTTVNLALQAIEDTIEGNKAALSTIINTATSPYVFTVGQKKILFAVWALQKFTREGV